MRKRNKLILGVGVNDADYEVQGGTRITKTRCQFYVRWVTMLKRCYSKIYHSKRPTYIGCSVCIEWLTFSNFKSWMERQDWEGKALDKDILMPGNKVYSPETCVFVDAALNSFTTDSSASRGGMMLGVSTKKDCIKLLARCSNPFTGKQEEIGFFSDELSAHLAWKKRKHELACQLADKQTDDRVANALRNRYAEY